MKHNIAQRRNLDLLRVIDLTTSEVVTILCARIRVTNGLKPVPQEKIDELRWQLDRLRWNEEKVSHAVQN